MQLRPNFFNIPMAYNLNIFFFLHIIRIQLTQF